MEEGGHWDTRGEVDGGEGGCVCRVMWGGGGGSRREEMGRGMRGKGGRAREGGGGRGGM